MKENCKCQCHVENITNPKVPPCAWCIECGTSKDLEKCNDCSGLMCKGCKQNNMKILRKYLPWIFRPKRTVCKCGCNPCAWGHHEDCDHGSC